MDKDSKEYIAPKMPIIPEMYISPVAPIAPVVQSISTKPILTSDVKKGKYVIIKGRPCKVMNILTSKA